jgi:hypothetical protein
VKFQEFEYISGNDPLFTHLCPQAWFDFRHERDVCADYFANSVTAIQAHKPFCVSLRDEFPDYCEHLWGITSSDSAAGYQAWGGPPRMGRLDGSVVPMRGWRFVAVLAGRLHAGAVDDPRVLSESLGTIWICRCIQSADRLVQP